MPSKSQTLPEGMLLECVGEQNHKRYTFSLDSQPPEGKYELCFFINGIRCTVPIEMAYQ